MSRWIDQLKASLPEYANDLKVSLDTIIQRSSINVEQAEAVALAAAFAAGNGKLVALIKSGMENTVERDAALSAGIAVVQRNAWKYFVTMANDKSIKDLEPELCMDMAEASGGTTKSCFGLYCLAASIVCDYQNSIKEYYEMSLRRGYSTNQLCDIGRIAAVISALAIVLHE